MATITKHSEIGCNRKGTKQIKTRKQCPRTFMGSKKITIFVFQYPTPLKYNISSVAIIIFSHFILHSLHMSIFIIVMVVVFDML
jgi:hypothetical protein